LFTALIDIAKYIFLPWYQKGIIMKKSMFLPLFIFTNISFIFLQIHKHSKFIKLSYDKQSKEKEKNELLKQKQELGLALHTYASNKETIKKFAIENLHMKKIKLIQLKKLEKYE